jgi:hypothetical protein
VKVFKNGEFREKISKNLYPGDVIKVEQGEEVPVDGFLMKVTNQRNCCYFETINIDNDKHLVKKVMPQYEEGANEEDLVEFINMYVNNTIVCDQPTSDFNSFNGRLMTVGSSIKLSIGIVSFASNIRKLRACWIIHAHINHCSFGCIVYRSKLQNHPEEHPNKKQTISCGPIREEVPKTAHLGNQLALYLLCTFPRDFHFCKEINIYGLFELLNF